MDAAIVCLLLLFILGVGLPALLAARSDADAQASKNNLRQIGQATLTYEKTIGRLPFGTYHDNSSISNSAHPSYHAFYSGFMAILPHLGHDELFNRYEPKRSPDDATDPDQDGWSNRRVTETQLKIFISPAMPVPEAPPSPGWSSYAWSGGNNDFKKLNGGNLTGGSGGWHDGAIVNAKQGPVKLQHIEDGTSHTFLAGDAHYTLKGLTHSDRDPKLKGKPLTGNCVWGRGHYPRGFLSTNTPLNTHQSAHSNPNMEDWFKQGAFGFRSVHPGGCHFVFCDGSVKFVRDSIPMALYKALGSRSGGEPIAATDY
ncbi:DUF1559 family PulG-like putative transporter [Tuwongella immobilis]|uniref:DUF1559 family PulG-like putative transporter n=1 Tax=Tuwongella immobilis TaxID=692036 RepID=UPI001E5838CF|nr:DUF1559 domain-containing protein [Tuwongella immobilis]